MGGGRGAGGVEDGIGREASSRAGVVWPSGPCGVGRLLAAGAVPSSIPPGAAFPELGSRPCLTLGSRTGRLGKQGKSRNSSVGRLMHDYVAHTPACVDYFTGEVAKSNSGALLAQGNQVFNARRCPQVN